MRQRQQFAVFTVLVLCLLPLAAPALINPKYTPVDLYEASDAIAILNVSVSQDPSLLTVTNSSFLKGKPVIPDAILASAGILESAGESFSADPSFSVLFFGNFNNASLSGSGSGDALGALYTAAGWFAVTRNAEGRMQLARDSIDLRSVWAGAPDMLAHLVKEIARAPARAAVPVNSGLRLSSAETGPRLGTDARGLLPVSLPVLGRCLLALSPEGDRLLALDRNKGIRDLTETSRLKSASIAGTWHRFPGRPGPEFISMGDKSLRVFAMVNGHLVERWQAPAGERCYNLQGIGKDIAIATQQGIKIVTPETGRQPVFRTIAKTGSGPCVAADFDNDGYRDLLQVTGTALILCRGTAAGFENGRIVCTDLEKDMLGTPIAADYDNDGWLDLLATGIDGIEVFRNLNGRFVSYSPGSGEPRYVARPEINAVAGVDLNADGRRDFILFYPDGSPLTFFSRGYFCFGVASDLDFSESNLEESEHALRGQLTGTAADLDGDGRQEIALVDREGTLVVYRTEPRRKLLSLSLQLSATQGPGDAPVSVTIKDRYFNYGVFDLPTSFPLYLGVRRRGPVELLYRHPAGRTRPVRIPVTRSFQHQPGAAEESP